MTNLTNRQELRTTCCRVHLAATRFQISVRRTCLNLDARFHAETRRTRRKTNRDFAATTRNCCAPSRAIVLLTSCVFTVSDVVSVALRAILSRKHQAHACRLRSAHASAPSTAEFILGPAFGRTRGGPPPPLQRGGKTAYARSVVDILTYHRNDDMSRE